MTEEVSRRDFVRMAGAAVGGIALGAVGGYSLVSGKETIVTQDVPLEVPEHPWTYTKIDPEAAAKRGYDAFFNGGCCYGVYEGIIGELREQVGHPFSAIPTKLAVFGKGGVVGWGTVCGAINGAGMAINTVTNNLGLVNEVTGWYTETAFPNYVPAVAGKVEGELEKSVSNSPLCHASVTKWCNASGFDENSPERGERCGRIVYETIYKTVEMLNDLADDNFVAAYASPENVIGCNSCHSPSGEVNNVMSKMDCDDCHTDAHGN